MYIDSLSLSLGAKKSIFEPNLSVLTLTELEFILRFYAKCKILGNCLTFRENDSYTSYVVRRHSNIFNVLNNLNYTPKRIFTEFLHHRT